MPESRRAVTFIVATLALTATLLAAVAFLNWRVDPFQQYRLASADQVRFPRLVQRYVNPGIAKNASYDFLITGSSLMENYDLPEVNRVCNVNAVNLATAAISAFEERTILETALRHRAPRRVVMTLDFNSFAPPVDASLPEITDPLPLYLYDDNPLNDFRYLVSGPVTMRALAILGGKRIDNYSTDFNSAWSWHKEVSFSRARALKDIDAANINRRFKQGPRTIERMRASFDTNIAAMIERNPGTEFNLVFPPYSIVVWADFVQRDQLAVSLEFKKYVFERLRALPNARIFDLQWDESITHNLELYSDIYHFNPAINRQLLASVCANENRYRVTERTLTEFDARLREQALRVNVSRLLQQP